jgi:putative ABC transport system permease protein
VVNFNRVLPGFFKTLEIPLIKGRDVGDQDTPGSPAVALVNESFVRKFLKGKEPLGTTFRVDEGAGVPESVYQVIGIVGDTKYEDLRDDFAPIAYLAIQQEKRPDTNALIAIRSSLSMEDLTASIEHSLAQINPAIRIQFSVFKKQVRDTLLRERLMASLSGFFGFLAGLLATIGLYGVMSYMVVRRRNEIGIRMALGADRGRVLGLIMREAGNWRSAFSDHHKSGFHPAFWTEAERSCDACTRRRDSLRSCGGGQLSAGFSCRAHSSAGGAAGRVADTPAFI